MRRSILIAAILTISATTAGAQPFEISPMIGYRWGGELSASQTDVLDDNASIDSSFGYALFFGIPIGNHIQIELIADHQSSRLGNARLFEPPRDAADIDITYYHVGFLWQWTPNNLRPYVAASLGIASLDLDIEGARREERFSSSIGGGLKILATEHVAFRIDGRLFWADTGNWGSWSSDDDCHGYCSSWDYMPLVQQEIKVGVSFLF